MDTDCRSPLIHSDYEAGYNSSFFYNYGPIKQTAAHAAYSWQWFLMFPPLALATRNSRSCISESRLLKQQQPIWRIPRRCVSAGLRLPT
jgi:hypothetical protein